MPDLAGAAEDTGAPSAAPSAPSDDGAGRSPIARFWLWLALVAVGGLALRLGHLQLVRDDVVLGDGAYYHLQANRIANGVWFRNVLTPMPDAHHPPLWTLALAAVSALGFRGLFDQQVFASLLGTATIVVIGITGRRLAGDRAGVIAAVIAAVYPGLWLYERMLLSETLLLLLVALFVLVAYAFWKRPTTVALVGLGVLCGLLALTRSEQILLAPLVIAPLVLGRRQCSWARRGGWLALAAAVVVATTAPWTIYNLGRFDRPVLLSTSFGQAVGSANCDIAYYGKLIGSFDNGCLARTGGANLEPDQSVRDARLRAAAFDYMGDHAERVPLVMVARVGRAFSVFDPFDQIDREWALQHPRTWVSHGALFLYWLLLVPAVLGAVVLRRRRMPIYPMVGLAATAAIATAITIGETRYRAAAEVPIVLLSAIAIDALVRRARPAASDATAGVRPAPRDGPVAGETSGERSGEDRDGPDGATPVHVGTDA